MIHMFRRTKHFCFDSTPPMMVHFFPVITFTGTFISLRWLLSHFKRHRHAVMLDEIKPVSRSVCTPLAALHMHFAGDRANRCYDFSLRSVLPVTGPQWEPAHDDPIRGEEKTIRE